MAITMCKNDRCNQRDKCYRYLAQPMKYEQEYEHYYPMGSGECPQFWDITDYAPNRLRRVDEVDFDHLFSPADLSE